MKSFYKEQLLKYLLLSGAVSSLVNLPILYNISTIFMFMVAFFSALYMLLYILVIKNKLDYRRASSFALVILFVQVLNISIWSGSDYMLIYWMLIFPVTIFSLKCSRAGLIYSFLLLLLFLLMFIFSVVHESYEWTHVISFSLLYLTMLIVFYFTNINITNQENELLALNDSLEKRIKIAVTEVEKKEILLKQQTRLAQMGEMISMIAHQWRQPLGAINSAIMGINVKLDIGKYDLKNEKDRREFLSYLNQKHQNVSSYVKVLSTTIDDFRNFFKPEKEKENVALVNPVYKALGIVKDSMKSKNIEIVLNLNVHNKVYIFQNEMMQVILNILKNSEDNFKEKNIEKPFIKISSLYENDKNIIRIEDNGGGIEEDIIENIFDPYFSTKDEKNGSGLGLYMSKLMVEDHNGGILSVENIYTKDKKGICFKIIL